MTLERDVRVFEGIRNRPEAQENAAPVAIAALYEYSAGAGIPLPQLTPEQMGQWGGEVFLFPNFFVLPQYGNASSYRCRPYGDDPEKCLFEVWSLTLYPEGHDPGRASLMGRFAQDDENWGLIPRQDFSNMERQQRGLHSDSFKELRLATEWEGAITNLHLEVDRYIDGSW